MVSRETSGVGATAYRVDVLFYTSPGTAAEQGVKEAHVGRKHERRAKSKISQEE